MHRVGLEPVRHPAVVLCPGGWPVDEEAVRLRAYFISLENPGRAPQENWDQALAEYHAAMERPPPRSVGFFS